MPSNPLFDEVSASTIEAFTKGQVARTLFTATPWLRKLRTSKEMRRIWQGGSYQKVPFDLQPSPSGAYAPGTDTFGLQQLQELDDMVFAPKFYFSEIVILASLVDVYNRDKYQIVNLLKEKYGNASNSIDSKIAADIYVHGQALGNGVTSGNRVKNVNGIAEFLNNGTDNAWTGDIFQTIGGQLRNGPLTGTTLNSVPYWGGDQAGNPGIISNQILNRIYNRCKQGKGEGQVIGGKPDIGLCSDFLYGCISDRIFAMQRVDAEIRDPHIGMTGVKFNNAVIFPDSYSPGTQNSIYIQDQSVLPTITTGTFTSTATPSAYSNIPASTTLTVGEVFTWMRSDTWRFTFPSGGRYGFKARGLQEAFDGDILADIIRAALVQYCLVNSSNQTSYGFNG